MNHDIELVKSITKVAEDGNKMEVIDRTTDYWLAKDIYSDSDITLKDIIAFLRDRINRTK